MVSRGFCELLLIVVGADDDGSGGFVLGAPLPAPLVLHALTDDGEVELGRVVDGAAAFEELELHPHAATATTQTNAKLVRIEVRH
jgi:hypothetical protein